MTHTEKVKQLRDATLCPMNKINDALKQANGDVDKAKEFLTKEMSKTDLAEMEKRTANATIVYGYVHNNRIGALLTIACQTDFVARNETFLNLAKDICMHIVSTPIPPEYIDLDPNDTEAKNLIHVWYENEWKNELEKKPEHIRQKILDGKVNSRLKEICLLRQPFIKDDKITIGQLIANVSAQTREKIEIKKFVRMIAS